MKEEQRKLIKFKNLRSIDHKIYLMNFSKIGLSCFENKRYLLDDGINSNAYGHYEINKE
jgi:hypothetical protein